MSAPGPKATIEYAREWLRERLHDGATCPACTQHVQLYKRKLNSGMAKALIQIYRHAGQEWTRVQDMPNAPKGGDYAKLRFWDLLIPRADRAQDGNSSVDGCRAALHAWYRSLLVRKAGFEPRLDEQVDPSEAMDIEEVRSFLGV